MPLTAFDHVNIRTKHLDRMVTWYTDILGLRSGDRPPFPFPGAWMYLGDHPVVHLVGVDREQITDGDIALEHFAFRAKGFTDFRANLDTFDIAYSIDPVPGIPVVQINLRDTDGNHIHIDFDAAEAT